MHFSMDKWTTQQLGLNLPPPPQCYTLWIDCARAALLTQLWRMWREELHKSPWPYQCQGSTAPWATGTGAQVLHPGSVKPLSRPPLITEASMGPSISGRHKQTWELNKRHPRWLGFGILGLWGEAVSSRFAQPGERTLYEKPSSCYLKPREKLFWRWRDVLHSAAW